MFKRIIYLVLPVLFLSIAASFAQMPDLKGKKEISLQGMFSIQSDSKFIMTQVSIGHYLNDRIQLGPIFGFMYSGSTMANGGFFIKYHIPTQSKTVPYFGGAGGAYITSGGGETSVMGMGSGYGGIKYFMSENRTFFVEYSYLRYFAEGGSMGYSGGTFGFSVLF